MKTLQGVGLLPHTRPRMPHFAYLRQGGPSVKLDDILLLRDAFVEMVEGERRGEEQFQGASSTRFATNLVGAQPDLIKSIHALYGEHGLARFQLLSSTQDKNDFDHFYEMIKSDLFVHSLFTDIPEAKMECDNASLRAGPEIDRLAHNVVNVALSRKLYNPGNYQRGTLVYGLGGSRILLSLPFKGVNAFHYDVYNNTIDVITSLLLKGYHGSFFALDRNDSLNSHYYGLPGWLVWFSFVAAHSDLIVFVKERAGRLTELQQQEARLTPDRVPKKIVEIDELTWGKADTLTADQLSLKVVHALPGKGIVSQAEFAAKEREFAEQFIKIYQRESFPNDRLILLHEDDRITEHPLVDLV